MSGSDVFPLLAALFVVLVLIMPSQDHLIELEKRVRALEVALAELDRGVCLE